MEDQNLSERRVPIIHEIVSTGLGSGLSPVAPGTAGSIVALLIYFIPGFEKIGVISSAVVVLFLWGTYSSGIMERAYGHDPSRVVIDEIVGMWVSLIFLPKTVTIVVIAFLLFRVLDILKPYPANLFDRSRGGIAIMMDDLVCGIYANLLLQISMRLI